MARSVAARVLIASATAALTAVPLALTSAGTATGVTVVRRVTPTPSPVRTVTPTARPTTPSDPVVPARYLSQALTWRPCFTAAQLREAELPLTYLALQCSTYKVPLDWDDAFGAHGDLTIAISKLAATRPPRGRDGRPNQAVVFTNPGGPGGPGRTLPLSFLDAERTPLLAVQDVYGIDVRGTGDSTTLTCGGWSQVSIDYRDRRAEAIDLNLDLSDAHARACQLFGHSLSPYVTTPQTVRDLDLLRRLVGRQTINWIGYSAGTWLGVQYATAFPHHVGRFVLDSNTDFTATWQDVFNWQPMAFERRFRQDFASWAAAHHDYFGLGSTAVAVRQSYETLRAGLQASAAADPSSVPLDGSGLDSLIAEAMYSKDSFQDLGEILVLLQRILDSVSSTSASSTSASSTSASSPAVQVRAAAARTALARVSGRLAAARRAAETHGPRLDPRPAYAAGDAFDATFYSIACGDTPWTGDRTSLTSDSDTAGQAYPLLGWSTLDQPCVFWTRPSPGAITPVPTGAGLPTMLMVQSDHDPATAYEGAVHAASTFTAARLLEVTGEGDHGIYGMGNDCVDSAVETFLTTGVLPAPAATCPGVGDPELASSMTSLDAAGLAASPPASAGTSGTTSTGRAGTAGAGVVRRAVPLVGSVRERNPLLRAEQVRAALRLRR